MIELDNPEQSGHPWQPRETTVRPSRDRSEIDENWDVGDSMSGAEGDVEGEEDIREIEGLGDENGDLPFPTDKTIIIRSRNGRRIFFRILRTAFTVSLAILMLLTGTVNTIVNKFQDDVQAYGLSGCQVYEERVPSNSSSSSLMEAEDPEFRHPTYQTLQMFLGELLLLPFAICLVGGPKLTRSICFPLLAELGVREKDKKYEERHSHMSPSTAEDVDDGFRPPIEEVEGSSALEEDLGILYSSEVSHDEAEVSEVVDVENDKIPVITHRNVTLVDRVAGDDVEVQAERIFPDSPIVSAGADDVETGFQSSSSERKKSVFARIRRSPVASFSLFMIPAACDCCATTFLFLGLMMTYASVYQMLRGTLVVFVALFSIIFLKRRLKSFHWLGLLGIVVGCALVGAASMIYPPPEGENVVATNPMWGDIFTVVAQLFAAIQFIVEEKFLSSRNVAPIVAVSAEGTWGVFIVSLALLFFNLIPGDDCGRLENTHQTFAQMSHSWGTAIGCIISIALFNLFGLTITRRLSATHRSTIDACRTLLVWLVSLILGWERVLWLQILGFLVLVYGTFLYNEVVAPPWTHARRLHRVLSFFFGRFFCCFGRTERGSFAFEDAVSDVPREAKIDSVAPYEQFLDEVEPSEGDIAGERPEYDDGDSSGDSVDMPWEDES